MLRVFSVVFSLRKSYTESYVRLSLLLAKLHTRKVVRPPPKTTYRTETKKSYDPRYKQSSVPTEKPFIIGVAVLILAVTVTISVAVAVSAAVIIAAAVVSSAARFS